MNNLSLIATVDKNYGTIDNQLFWRVPEIFDFYNDITFGKNIVVDQSALFSMPCEALDNRTIFVLSSQKLDSFFDVNSFANKKKLLSYIGRSKEQFFVIGTSLIYGLLLPHVNTMYLTLTDEYFGVDTCFPVFDKNCYSVTLMGEFQDGDLGYIRKKYVRKKEI